MQLTNPRIETIKPQQNLKNLKIQIPDCISELDEDVSLGLQVTENIFLGGFCEAVVRVTS